MGVNNSGGDQVKSVLFKKQVTKVLVVGVISHSGLSGLSYMVQYTHQPDNQYRNNHHGQQSDSTFEERHPR